MSNPVLTKQDFVKRYKAGEFGNASPTWNNPDEFRESGYVGLVHIRNRVASADTWYNVRSCMVQSVWREALEKFSPESLYISAMAPMHQCIFQGEVIQTEQGLSLLYSRVAKPMREALSEESKNVKRTIAVVLLRSFLCARSLDWLHVLLKRYPFHAVEFSTFSREWGTLRGYNTVFWEVRLY